MRVGRGRRVAFGFAVAVAVAVGGTAVSVGTGEAVTVAVGGSAVAVGGVRVSVAGTTVAVDSGAAISSVAVGKMVSTAGTVARLDVAEAVSPDPVIGVLVPTVVALTVPRLPIQGISSAPEMTSAARTTRVGMESSVRGALPRAVDSAMFSTWNALASPVT